MINYTTKDIGDNKLLISDAKDNIEVDKYEWLQLVRMLRDKIKNADNVKEVEGIEYLANQVIAKYSIVTGPKEDDIPILMIILDQVGKTVFPCAVRLDYIDHIDCFTASVEAGSVTFNITESIVSIRYNSVYSGFYDLELIINLLSSSNANEIIEYMENNIHDKNIQKMFLGCLDYTGDSIKGINNMTVVETEDHIEFIVKDTVILRFDYEDMENKVSNLTGLIVEMINSSVWSKNYKPGKPFNG